MLYPDLLPTNFCVFFDCLLTASYESELMSAFTPVLAKLKQLACIDQFVSHSIGLHILPKFHCLFCSFLPRVHCCALQPLLPLSASFTFKLQTAPGFHWKWPETSNQPALVWTHPQSATYKMKDEKVFLSGKLKKNVVCRVFEICSGDLALVQLTDNVWSGLSLSF